MKIMLCEQNGDVTYSALFTACETSASP